jgi:hypothetical protein
MVLFITAAVGLPMMEKRGQNLLSGQKKLDKEITLELNRHLSSKSVMPTNVRCVQVVIGGNHGNTAFQFGASVSVKLSDNRIINFEVSIWELVCRRDTGHLLEELILQQLTSGLETIPTFQLHLFTDYESGVLVVVYPDPCSNVTPGHIPITKVFVTGDLAFQAMALGKDSMAGHHCMQYKSSRQQLTDLV